MWQSGGGLMGPKPRGACMAGRVALSALDGQTKVKIVMETALTVRTCATRNLVEPVVAFSLLFD